MNDVFYSCHFMGGLGNQLFQAANTLAQSWENGAEPIFSKEAFVPMQGYKPINYIDNVFRNLTFSDNKDIKYDKYAEKTWAYHDKDFKKDNNIKFYGYYQSSKNFHSYKNEIYELFKPTDEYINKMYERYPDLKIGDNVCVHVRRGDYLKILNILPTVDISYIKKCLSLLPYYNKIFVISDDIDWVQNNLKLDNTVFIKNDHDYEDLWFIGLNKYNILSNSSFSWWGSFFNKFEDKRIFAPSIWFGYDGEKNYKDIYEPYWEVIEVINKNGILCC